MRAADWRTISNIGYGIGGLFFLGGVFAMLYEEERFFVKVAPYRELGLLLFVVGVALLAVGFQSDARAKEEEKLESEPVEPKREVGEKKFFCRYCGAENKHDAVFCERCGKKL